MKLTKTEELAKRALQIEALEIESVLMKNENALLDSSNRLKKQDVINKAKQIAELTRQQTKDIESLVEYEQKIAELKEYVTHKEDCREWDGDDCGCGLDELLNKH